MLEMLLKVLQVLLVAAHPLRDIRIMSQAFHGRILQDEGSHRHGVDVDMLLQCTVAPVQVVPCIGGAGAWDPGEGVPSLLHRQGGLLWLHRQQGCPPAVGCQARPDPGGSPRHGPSAARMDR